MPAAPEFLLRKLYVPGSLKSLPDGFSIILNDTLVPVTVFGMSISADDVPIASQDLYLSLSGQPEINASIISEQNPLQLALNIPLVIRAIAKTTKPLKLIIEANSKEIGALRFSLDFRPHGLQLSKPIKKIMDLGREAVKRFRVINDPHHPIYHFTPPANWMNDPNGLVFWQGQNHLFYQFNPNEPVWGNIHWGHTVSPDLVHWKRLPVAMKPNKNQPDQDGCWTGSAFKEENTLRFFYTGVFPETVCMAEAGKNLKTLVKYQHNPVISEPPPGLQLDGFRDPVVWRETDGYYMTVGSGISGKGGAVLLFRSVDLTKWEYLHPILAGDGSQTTPLFTGSIWECPQLIKFGSKYLLIVSVYHASKLMYAIGFLGEYRDQKFFPVSTQKLDHGDGVFYAPQSVIDHKGRQVLMGWVMEEREEAACQKAGWAGALSLPRVLTVDESGRLLIDPIPEMEQLHKGTKIHTSGILAASLSPILGSTPICNHEIDIDLYPGKNSLSGIRLSAEEKALEFVEIAYDQNRQILIVDTHYDPSETILRDGTKEAAVQVRLGEKLQLKVYVDGSVIEIYAQRKTVITTRFYPDYAKKLLAFGFSKIDTSKYEIAMWAMQTCF
ncbi:MAG TPA: glycoside hydrolase family 32 protein [Longilinea sp.]|nr:glycoside hydrolase family 32 protein [Longilinea sp.]